MTIKVPDSVKKQVSIKEKCIKCFKGTNLIRTIVTFACFLLLLQQISACILKLIYIPITTYTHFDFNKTIMYPSVTFCREPPYKFDKLLEYGLVIHPRYTSAWMNFNFSRITLDQLWDEVTYNITDFFVQYGLEHERNNVILTPTMGFVTGRCYTASPKWYNTTATSQAQGYSFTLQHTMADIEAAFGTVPPGYHVHIHYTKEPYTEVEVYNGGLVDYVYVNTGETLDVKLTVNEYVKISEEDDPCVSEDNYSTNACTSQYVWNQVGKAIGCSGPWMDNGLPYCDNYDDMRDLISTYITAHEHHDCKICHRICRSLLYNGFVQDRQKFYHWNSNGNSWHAAHTITSAADLQTTIYIHFNNMMVSVFEERYNYDWNLFLSDLGGSVGFLLGLSVIGLLGILSNWLIILAPAICNKIEKNDNGHTVAAENTTDEEFKKHDRKSNIYVVN